MITPASYQSLGGDRGYTYSDKAGAPRMQWAGQYEDWGDADHKYTPPPWYWRVVAFIGTPCILLAGFLAIQPLYERDPQLTVPKTALTVLSIACLTLAWSLTPLLCFAVHSPSFRNEAIFIPGLSSSLLGLANLTLNFVFTTRYQWGFQAYLGVAAAAGSTVVYLALVIWTQIKIGRGNWRSGGSEAEHEAPLLSHDRGPSPAPSYASTQQPTLPPVTGIGWGIDTTQLHGGWTAANDTHAARRRSSPHATPYAYSPTASPARPPLSSTDRPLPSTPDEAARDTSLRRRSSLTSGVALPQANGEAAVTTMRTPSPTPEDEETRQQMLRLLVNRASEQAIKNPNNQTFQIEVPKHMREVLLRASTDNESIRRAATAQRDYRGRPRERSSRRNLYKSGSTQASVRDVKGVGAYMKSKASLISVKHLVSPGGASVQGTPASAYAPNAWKTREERRREIELGSRRFR